MDTKSNIHQFLIQKYLLFNNGDYKECKKQLDSIIDLFDDNALSSASTSVPVNASLTQLLNQSNNDDSVHKDIQMISNLTISDKLYCTACEVPFIDREEQVSHYKSDLHRFNLKQKLNGKPCVSIHEFESLADDISSISGSDESQNCSADEDDDNGITHSDSESSQMNKDEYNKYGVLVRSQPKIAFRLSDNNIIVMYRCLLHGKKNIPATPQELISHAKSLTNLDQWCIILVNAGHFASAIFKGDEIIMHKTFHRYVIRAKNGTVQSAHDSSGKHARSAGANIRRHHEAAFKDDIKSLLEQWKKELDKCKCIFLRAPKYNQQIFFAGKNPLFTKYDIRIRHIPFMTLRPTFNEVQRVHGILKTIELYNSFYHTTNTAKVSPVKDTVEPVKAKSQEIKTDPNELRLKSDTDDENEAVRNIRNAEKSDSEDESSDEDNQEEEEEIILNNKKTKRKLKLKENNENVKKPKETKNNFITNLDLNSIKIFNEFYSVCQINDYQKLDGLFGQYEKHENLSEILNQRFNTNGITLLHLVSQAGHAECVSKLLAHDCDPTIADLDTGKVAYELAIRKSVRDQFRRFMNDFPHKYDYKQAKIPSALSTEKEQEKRNKDKEKKRVQRKMKKERELDAKQKQEQLNAENDEKRKFLSLTDEEKRALLIDRKFIANNTAANATVKQKKLVEQFKKEAVATGVQIALNLPKNLSRCWYCGENLSTNEPFEYYDYKFCSIKCLKTHRQNTNSSANKNKKP